MDVQGVATIFQEHPAYQQVLKILYWRDLTTTLLLFSIGNMFFFLVTLGEYTFLSLFSYILVVQLSLSLIYKFYSSLNSQPDPFQKIHEVVPAASSETQSQAVKTVTALLQLKGKAIKRAFSFRDQAYSLRFVGLLVGISIIGSLMSFAFLSYSAFLIVFIWPRLYEEKKIEIDAVFGKVVEALPPQVQGFISHPKRQ